MLSMYDNDADSFRDLLEAFVASSDVNSEDDWGVLHAGVYLGHKECVFLYLHGELVPVAKKLSAVADEEAYTALHIACTRGDMAIVEAIAEQMSLLR